MFNSDRLKLARERRGLTKRILAESVGLSVRALSNYENKLDYDPKQETVASLAEALNFPVEFFYGESVDTPTIETASFRSMYSLQANKKHKVFAAGALAFALSELLDKLYTLPTEDLPDFAGEEPEDAAQSLRVYWGLGDKPISNMMHLLEAKGVRIFSLMEDSKRVSAYSQWHNETPYIFLNNNKSAEHSRFTLAHELGHLVLHRELLSDDIDLRTIEREADAFASAFLMPRSDVYARAKNILSRTQIIKIKKRWGVSAVGLAVRLHKLGLLTDWHYQRLMVNMSKAGDRTKEPDGLPMEISLLFRKIFASMSEERVTRQELAEKLHVYPEEIDSLVFGLSNVLLVEETPKLSAKRAHLRLVK
ncbi:transcriptional regulator [Kordiimonas sediminis]|uniref:Transcriptional regulator n=1 Tax=Kordiimonas sediminis TaxID=1735581 RepID=A0A919E5F1_9PROT|nr:ImmA/IrrE family metallo-endopeptidase [Kordiimonas sediminis]GHF14687.1 transcriptional regulator [Kordiimonas sediminis]